MTAPLTAPLALVLVALALLAPAQAVDKQETLVPCRNDDRCPDELACMGGVCRDPCPYQCGPNAICQVVEHEVTCSCPPEYKPMPMPTCVPDDVPPQCHGNKHCPDDKVCEYYKCVDPCENLCGANAECSVSSHVPDCHCRPGFTGEPILGCTLIPPPECVVNEDCPIGKSCVNEKCVDPCLEPCGHNAVCRVTGHQRNCECLPGFVGNPISGCDQQKCASDTECPLEAACIDDVCKDPCVGKCAFNATCKVINHYQQCECLPGHVGDPLILCAPCEPIVITTPANNKVKRFYIHKQQGKWRQAGEFCRSNSSNLATIMSKEENDQVLSLIQGNGVNYQTFWIGGTDMTKENKWIWESTGKPIRGYTYWATGKPNDLFNQDCLAYHETVLSMNGGYFWDDKSCNTKASILCEYLF